MSDTTTRSPHSKAPPPQTPDKPAPTVESSAAGLLKKIDSIKAKAAERAARDLMAEALDTTKPLKEPATSQIHGIRPGATTTAGRMTETDKRLRKMEQLGHFKSYPLAATNEFPTLLTRLPIFRPSHRSTQKRQLDDDNALAFETPFGAGRRHGPSLTVRDEDTLIALMRLRDRRLFGEGQSLPIPVSKVFANQDGKVAVQCVVCSLQDINREKKLSSGGENYRATFLSIKRLAATSIELSIKRRERYLGSLEEGATIRMLDVKWELYHDDGIIFAQIPPVVAYWLDNEYTYLDWNVRLQLTDLGKCIHRFLSSQPKAYQGHLKRIAQSIGYDGPSKNMKPRFREALEDLRLLGWLQSYDFTGTGRRSPIILHSVR